MYFGERLQTNEKDDNEVIADLTLPESNQVRLIARMYEQIERVLPDIHELTLNYLGGGGDILSTLGHKQIRIISKMPFNRIGEDEFSPDSYATGLQQIWEMAVNADRNYLPWVSSNSVRPGVQIYDQLNRLGIAPETIDFSIGSFNEIKLSLPNGVTIDYVDEYIQSQLHFHQVVNTSVQQRWGLMCKGYRKGLPLMKAILNEGDSMQQPAFFITDDPRFHTDYRNQTLRALTLEEEQNWLFHDYECREMITNQVTWGYAGYSSERQYETRVVYGIRQDLVPDGF